MGAFVDFAKATSAALRRSADLAAIVGTKIFDDVPVQGEATAPTFPYVAIGDQQGTENGASGTDMTDMLGTIETWSRGAGRQQTLTMLDAIYATLHNKNHATATGVVVLMIYVSHETIREADGETYRGIIRFRGLYQHGLAD